MWKKLKGFLPLAGLSMVIVVIGLVAACVWIELFLIPRLLAKAGYSNAVVLHVVVIIAIVGLTAFVTAWLTRSTIFTVQEKLVAQHLHNLTSAIEHVVSGAWTNQASVEKAVFMTGAKLGYDVRDVLPPPPDRSQILEGIAAMSLPQPKQLTGESPEVIDTMGQYMDHLNQRKERLSV